MIKILPGSGLLIIELFLKKLKWYVPIAVSSPRVQPEVVLFDVKWKPVFFLLYTIFALIDHSPVGRIHNEEWA